MRLIGISVLVLFFACTQAARKKRQDSWHNHVAEENVGFFLRAGLMSKKPLKVLCCLWAKLGHCGQSVFMESHCADVCAGDFENCLPPPGEILLKWDAIEDASMYSIAQNDNGAETVLFEGVPAGDMCSTETGKCEFVVDSFEGEMSENLKYIVTIKHSDGEQSFFTLEPGKKPPLEHKLQWDIIPDVETYRIKVGTDQLVSDVPAADLCSEDTSTCDYVAKYDGELPDGEVANYEITGIFADNSRKVIAMPFIGGQGETPSEVVITEEPAPLLHTLQWDMIPDVDTYSVKMGSDEVIVGVPAADLCSADTARCEYVAEYKGELADGDIANYEITGTLADGSTTDMIKIEFVGGAAEEEELPPIRYVLTWDFNPDVETYRVTLNSEELEAALPAATICDEFMMMCDYYTEYNGDRSPGFIAHYEVTGTLADGTTTDMIKFDYGEPEE